MRLLALALALSCSSALAEVPDGGADIPPPPPVLLVSGRVVAVDGGVIDVEPMSAYLPPATLMAEGKAVADLQARNDSLTSGLRALPMPVVVGGVSTISTAITVGVALLLHFLPPKAPPKQ